MITVKLEDDMSATIIAALENQIDYWQKILARCVDPVDRYDCREFITDLSVTLEMLKGQIDDN